MILYYLLRYAKENTVASAGNGKRKQFQEPGERKSTRILSGTANPPAEPMLCSSEVESTKASKSEVSRKHSTVLRSISAKATEKEGNNEIGVISRNFKQLIKFANKNQYLSQGSDRSPILERTRFGKRGTGND